MTDVIVGYLVVGLALSLFLLSFQIRKAPTFPLVLLSRWFRWILFGLGMAYLLRTWEFSSRPYWSLTPTFLLVWILVESIYAWLAVKALSLSNLPVFPSYRGTTREVNWPVEGSYLRLKDEIRNLGFSLREKLVADLGEHMQLQSLLYSDEEKRTRLQVIFAPRTTGRPAIFLILTSKAGGIRWATDNVWLPYGGVFPREWRVDRVPFFTSLEKLFNRHRKSLEKAEAELEAFEENWVEELNGEQEILDRESTDRGVLLPRGQRPEYGKLSGEGRYRVWKQILLLNYFGFVGQRSAG